MFEGLWAAEALLTLPVGTRGEPFDKGSWDAGRGLDFRGVGVEANLL